LKTIITVALHADSERGANVLTRSSTTGRDSAPHHVDPGGSYDIEVTDTDHVVVRPGEALTDEQLAKKAGKKAAKAAKDGEAEKPAS